MYEEFFGLRETPFSVQPDPRYAYPSVEHKIAVAKMRYAVDGKRGLAVLTGPVGIGKCLGRGTPVLMHDGTVRAVEDVRVGDRLMGPDSTPRTVLSLAHGTDRLYRIMPVKGDPYVVNEPHILSLKLTGGDGRSQGEVVNLSVRDYLARAENFKRNVKGYRVGVEFDAQPVTLEPYFLGLWLGDGASDTPRIHTTDVRSWIIWKSSPRSPASPCAASSSRATSAPLTISRQAGPDGWWMGSRAGSAGTQCAARCKPMAFSGISTSRRSTRLTAVKPAWNCCGVD